MGYGHVITVNRCFFQPQPYQRVPPAKIGLGKRGIDGNRLVIVMKGGVILFLSVEDIEARIALLALEIERLKTDAVKKRASKDAANAFFKS